jgi:hypothetical protein
VAIADPGAVADLTGISFHRSLEITETEQRHYVLDSSTIWAAEACDRGQDGRPRRLFIEATSMVSWHRRPACPWQIDGGRRPRQPGSVVAFTAAVPGPVR